MLAVLFIKMHWIKSMNNPKCAEQRKPYLKPVKIEEDLPLDGEGIFFKRCIYSQYNNQIFSEHEYKRNFKENLGKTKHVPFSSSEERKQRGLRRAAERRAAYKGIFTKLDSLDIPSVNIIPETDNRYRVKWFWHDGMPYRKGGNEDLYNPDSKLCGKPNILNETAFILEEGQSGRLEYNYRFNTDFDAEHYYEQYCVYLVNADKLTRNIFLRKYDYDYKQLERLF